jgi:hypothetical protein
MRLKRRGIKIWDWSLSSCFRNFIIVKNIGGMETNEKVLEEEERQKSTSRGYGFTEKSFKIWRWQAARLTRQKQADFPQANTHKSSSLRPKSLLSIFNLSISRNENFLNFFLFFSHFPIFLNLVEKFCHQSRTSWDWLESSAKRSNMCWWFQLLSQLCLLFVIAWRHSTNFYQQKPHKPSAKLPSYKHKKSLLFG